MLEPGSPHTAEGHLIEQPVAAVPAWLRLCGEAVLSPEDGFLQPVSPPLPHGEHKGEASGKVPSVAGQTPGQLIDDSGRPKQLQIQIPIQKSPQQSIETNQMIDMTMGDEDRSNFEQFPGGQGVQVTAIKEQCLATVGQMNIEGGITKGSVDQARIKYRPHKNHLTPNLMPQAGLFRAKEP